MKLNRKKALVTITAVICLLAISGMSKPGKAALNKMVSLVGIAPDVKVTSPELESLSDRQQGQSTSATNSSSQSVEQRARARHGWGPAVLNSVARGTITYYDEAGEVTQRVGIVSYRRYPDRMRIVLTRGAVVEILGFDGERAWKLGTATLTEEAARDIRAMLRAWPERLFVTRGGGARYREAGLRIEDGPEPLDGSARQSIMLDQVEMEDTIGPAPNATRVGDRRSVCYYVEQASSTITSARWLEPDNPRRSASDPNAPLMDVRVDFSDWRTVAGVLWPYEVTHKMGGRVDFRIQLSEVLVNQALIDSLFENPGR